ncbi:MAG: hypothetical protein LCH37_12770 [Bacteroidetes bacterium]|nr:hypothetical protein [Bacteroidota bacterium]
MNRRDYLKSMLILGISGSSILNAKPKSANKILILALGGAGCNCIEKLNKLPAQTDLICVSSREHPMPFGSVFLPFKANKSYDLFTKNTVELSRKEIAESDAMKYIKNRLNTTAYKQVIFVAGLGGSTGTGFCRHLLCLAPQTIEQTQANIHMVVSSPFPFESKVRAKAIGTLMNSLPKEVSVHPFPLSELLTHHGDMPFNDALEMINSRKASKIIELCRT